MILTCPECDTSFNFDDNMIKPSGSKVRCSKCHSVFTAYSQTESAAAPAAAASSAAAGLDDLDLDEITKDLDLELDTADEESSGDELDFDLGLEDEVAESPAGGETQFQETQELDLSDFDIDDSGEAPETPAEASAEDDISFDLDLDADDIAAASEDITAADTETKDISDLDFDLGIDLEEEGQASDSAVEEPEAEAAADDLDFSLDLDTDESPAAEDAAAADADLMDETRAMDLGELDDLLSSDEAVAEEDEAGGEAGSLDIDLDLDDDARTDEAVEDSTEEIDFDLGMDSDAGDAAAPMEETEELDLADLEEMIEVDEDSGSETDADVPMEETEELDLTGLEDALELQPSVDSAAETDDDLDLELDFDSDSAEPAVAGELEEDDEGEFDLTDLDDMLEMDEDVAGAPADSAGEEDFDLELDVEDADMEHQFDVEDDEEQAVSAAAAAGQEGAEMEDSFDMGTVAEFDETVEDQTYFDDDEMDYAAAKPAKKAGRGISRPFRILLVLVLLIGGGYGAVTLLKFFDVEVPGLDMVREMEIPYVSDLLGPKDAGNLNIAIQGRQLKGKFVENASLGTIYVVKGRIKNNYKHPRSYINITGKLYAKGGKLRQTKTVYAGNMLSDKRLANVNKAQLDGREKNRNGSKRSNVNVPQGKELPFMIVFTNLPPNPDEYSVEVAGSKKAD
jgi:predicted Zn finger-like uncharacterized protein